MNNTIEISGHSIGKGHPTFLIAEAGVNHNGNMDLAKQLIISAKKCGAHCVKFQTFKAERVVSETAPKAEYQIKNTRSEESQLKMLQSLEIPESNYVDIIRICQKNDIVFLSTPYSIEDIDFLNALNVPAFKIASGQTIELFFLEYVAKKQKPIILSTGMCTFSEVCKAVEVIRETGNNQIIVLQCTTNYPSLLSDCNLLAMPKMRDSLDVLVGYSDHTDSLIASTVAASLGACLIERHFTLDKTLTGPDHIASLDPNEYTQFVQQVREVELALGSSIKKPACSEKSNAKTIRRSLIASKDIQRGELLTWKNITLLRPLIGLSGLQADLVIGKYSAINIKKNSFINLEMIC